MKNFTIRPYSYFLDKQEYIDIYIYDIYIISGSYVQDGIFKCKDKI